MEIEVHTPQLTDQRLESGRCVRVVYIYGTIRYHIGVFPGKSLKLLAPAPCYAYQPPPGGQYPCRFHPQSRCRAHYNGTFPFLHHLSFSLSYMV